MRYLGLGLLVVLGCTACAETPRLIGSDELARTQAQLEELARRDVASQLEIVRLRKRIADLEAELGAKPAVAHPTPSAPVVEEVGRRVSTLPERQPSEIEESELGEESIATGPDAETKLYDSALRLLRDGQPAEAEQALHAFAARHPDSELADNAWFWIGESRRTRSDLSGALDAYRTTIERYPEGNKVPDALFKMGQVLDLEGRREAAREAWSQLVRRYPGAAAAESARTLLARP